MKPVALLLHSGGMSSRQWRRLEARLAPTCEVIAPDFLGVGANPRWREGAPFDFQMDVDHAAACLAGRPAHVVGHSYGGLIALTLARGAPSQVLSLSTYDPVAFGVLRAPRDEAGLADLDRASNNPVFTDDARGGSEDWFEAFVDWWNGPGTWKSLQPESRANFLEAGRKTYLEVRSLMQDQTAASAYAGITAPVLLMRGERTPLAARHVSEALARALPRATVRDVEGAGHMGPITHGGAVCELVAAHVAAAEAELTRG